MRTLITTIAMLFSSMSLSAQIIDTLINKSSLRPFTVSVKVPDGNYRVTVTLGDKKRAAQTVVRAESRRLYTDAIATVRIPGGKGGTVTDIDGNYSLDVPAGTKMLQIDYVGYKTQLVNIKGGKASIAMNPDSQVMEEMVVIGYGAVKKGDVTNAVAQVKGDDLADRPVANIASALQGELAGVDIQTTDASPGAKVQVKVRGATSINEGDSSNPLFVVDGVPMDDEFDLSNLNPQDIESIEVLKDASSSAIYGSRGANGVIIVTSKKGSDDGKISVTASANFALATAERYIPVMSGDQWIDYRSQINKEKYVGAYPSAGATTEDSWVEQVIIARGGAGMTSVNDKRWSMPDHGGLSTVNWQKAMTHRALSQTYNLSITQGNKKNNYRASVSYVNQDGIVRNTGFKRLTTKLSGRTTLFDKLQIGLDVAPQFAVTKGGQVVVENMPLTYSINGYWEAAEALDAAEYTGAQFYAYYPYSENATFTTGAADPFAAMVAATKATENQSSKADYEAADIMTSTAATVGALNTVQIALRHHKALVCVELPNSSYIFDNPGVEPYVMAKAENAKFTLDGTTVQPYFDDASQSYRLILEPGQASQLLVTNRESQKMRSFATEKRK